MRETLVTIKEERGATIIEFVVVSLMFFVMLIAICAGGNLYFTHNALVESTRRGARFAAMQAATSPAGTPYQSPGTACDESGPSVTDIKNYTMYGNTAGTGSKLAPGLTDANICIRYGSLPSDPAGELGFGVGQGTVSVSIVNYDFHFVVPLVTRTIRMPPYKTTFVGENAGTDPLSPPACP
jgi:TadE-like protein